MLLCVKNEQHGMAFFKQNMNIKKTNLDYFIRSNRMTVFNG